MNWVGKCPSSLYVKRGPGTKPTSLFVKLIMNSIVPSKAQYKHRMYLEPVPKTAAKFGFPFI